MSPSQPASAAMFSEDTYDIGAEQKRKNSTGHVKKKMIPSETRSQNTDSEEFISDN